MSKKKKILFYFLMLLIPLSFVAGMLVAFERYLRHEWYFPGSFVRYFDTVDSLIVSNEMVVDSNGIQMANPEHYRHNDLMLELGVRINDIGFRSREFVPKAKRDSTAKTILFLGDSHTWGASADPITRCFVDLIDSMGYMTFNTGIPGADPAQYWAVAKTYIPYLEPDACYLIFDGSNDLMWFKRNPTPYIPLDYWTNAGAIDAWKSRWIEGEEGKPFKNAQEAYHFFVERYTLFGDSVSWFAKLCRHAVLTTKLYDVVTGWEDPESKIMWPDTPKADIYLDRIDSLCKARDIPFQIIVIPDVDEIIEDTAEYKKLYPGVFIHHKFLIPPGITQEDYREDEHHFNNRGHRKMAEFIVQDIKRKGIFQKSDSVQNME